MGTFATFPPSQDRWHRSKVSSDSWHGGGVCRARLSSPALLPSRPTTCLPACLPSLPADFLMYWELSKAAEERVEAIAAAVRGKRLILATDPDREGEAISWHLLQELKVPCGVAVQWGLLGGGNSGRVKAGSSQYRCCMAMPYLTLSCHTVMLAEAEGDSQVGRC